MDIEFNQIEISKLSFPFPETSQGIKPIRSNKSANYNHTAMLKYIFTYNTCKVKQIWKDTVLSEYSKTDTIIFCLIGEQINTTTVQSN